MKLILSKEAQKFIAKLDNKQAKQIIIKIKELQDLGHLHDSKKLKGATTEYHRTDTGEFRIIYQIESEALAVFLVGKRNDNEIYNRFKRKKK